MKDIILYNELYLCYEDLLTDNEKETFLDYYSEDLSLSEIADNNNISKAAVSKTVNHVIEKLLDYESKLHLNEKNNIVSEAIEKKDINVLDKYTDL